MQNWVPPGLFRTETEPGDALAESNRTRESSIAR